MQVPLLKAPYEFISINNDFEIMTKYQHYGMCTRLLNLTTNPLVALYFACEEYGDVCYKGIEDKEDTKIQEANGVIFFNKKYSVSTNEINIKVISSLSQIDLSNDNTLESILRKLTERQAISKELEERWKSKEHYEKFINIIQNNYIVTLPYNNERLSRQCEMFLLAGCFNFVYTESISESSIEKGYKDLRDEFDRKFFYISGENKKAILEELDTYNINEATLFPELEHQLSYIKNKKNAKTKASSEFIKFDFNDINQQIIKTDIENGKGGVFWHTQGSGKSLSMVFYAHLLQEALNSPTIVVLTDRNDLDDQLYGQFAKCKDFLRQEPMHAESRGSLKTLLAGRQANGIIFTTMQKFEESDEPLSERNNIVVMADEAHRGQYGLAEKIKITKNEDGDEVAKRVIGTARIIRNTLPNATYIGFTGTPISSKDRSTREVFGDYIDIYDMTQAVEDGATRPVYYESRVIKLNLDETTLKLIDAEYDLMALNADEKVIEKSKRELGQMEAVLGNDNTINSLVCDILDHYENNRENLLTGKAMIVAYSRPIAMKIYKRILELRPDWTEKIGVVMTSGNNDPEEWKQIIGNKHHKNELAKKFKDNDSPMKIAIVVDMWLTGFDVPSLTTMYVYKPMSGHNLMQAIARVNRVFRDKEGGLVVDYVGIATALKQAMNDYTSRDKKNYGDTDVAKVAYPKFLEKLSVCRDKFYGYDYTKFINGTDLERAKTISGAVNFIMDREKVDDKDSFVKEALMLHQALSLCSSLVDEDSRFEAAFFEAVRVLVLRLTNTGVDKKISLLEMNTRINELLKQSIKSDGVINLFSNIKEEFSLFDPKFLQEVANMKEKNLAVELLKKLISEQISVYRRTNIVKSEKFSEIMQRSLNAYLNGMLTNEEVIEEMLKLAKQIAAAHQEGDKLGLTADELAFYDALTKPQAIKDFYENEELIAITKELADTLRMNKTIDWQKRESARAKMRMLIKKLLKKHKYPPEGMDDAVQTVMTQCELWTDNYNFEEKVNIYSYNNPKDRTLLLVAEDKEKYN